MAGGGGGGGDGGDDDDGGGAAAVAAVAAAATLVKWQTERKYSTYRKVRGNFPSLEPFLRVMALPPYIVN